MLIRLILYIFLINPTHIEMSNTPLINIEIAEVAIRLSSLIQCVVVFVAEEIRKIMNFDQRIVDP